MLYDFNVVSVLCRKIRGFKVVMYRCFTLLILVFFLLSCSGKKSDQDEGKDFDDHGKNDEFLDDVEDAVSEKSDYLGINIHWDHKDFLKIESILSDLDKIGVKMVRIDWEWRVVEKEKGVYDWTVYDKLMRMAYSYQIDIYPMVHYPPQWAVYGNLQKEKGHFGEPPKEENYKDYAVFIKKSIERFGTNGNAPDKFRPIKYWEIWNEPNYDHFWSPENDFRQYYKMLKTVSEHVKPVYPDVKLVHGGLATADWVWLWQGYDTYPDYGDHYDILSVHPYFIDVEKGPRKPSDIDKDDEAWKSMGFIGSIEDPGYFGKVYNLRNLLHLMGDNNPDRPIWITETGFFTGVNPPAATQGKQAELLKETIDYAVLNFNDAPYRQNLYAVNVTKIFWFNYQDYGDELLPGTWGLIDIEGNRKLSYQTFKELMQNH